jgi:CRP-like cAMP-binding protein
MLDQLRRDIQTHLDELLGEVDKLRHALAALGSRSTPTAPRAGASRRAPAIASPAPETSKPARARRTSQAVTPSPPADKPAAGARRAAPGSTKAAVLAALKGGDALTAAQIAAATGLGRPTVSTTLSRLAKSGEVTKATRGYQIADNAQAGAAGSTSTA